MPSIETFKRERAIPSIVTDDRGMITYVNSAFEKAFGWSSAEIVGQTLSLILPAHFQDAHHLGFARFSTTGVSTVLNHPLRLKVVTKDNREIESEHFVIAEKQDGRWLFAATLRPLES